MPNRYRRLIALATITVAGIAPARAGAGPPFRTDDPEVVDLHHWELYLASQWAVADDDQVGSLPHFEADYGAVDHLQLHLLIPAVLAHAPGGTAYGLGDIELGGEWQFVRGGDGSRVPAMAIFPIITVPTGSEAHGLGVGTVTAFLPFWLEETLGCWAIIGGGGFRILPRRTFVETGLLLQRTVGGAELGAEVYVTLPTDGSTAQTQINLGATVDFTKHQHLLISGGPSFGPSTLAQAYIAYLLTI